VVSNSHAPFLRRFIDPSMEFYVAQPQLPAAAKLIFIAELEINDRD
jgi:hypothetical protein